LISVSAVHSANCIKNTGKFFSFCFILPALNRLYGKGNFWRIFYSTLLYLPPRRYNCVICRLADITVSKDYCDFVIDPVRCTVNVDFIRFDNLITCVAEIFLSVLLPLNWISTAKSPKKTSDVYVRSAQITNE
jgi:hypothetical protein